mmetsp:Transcript_11758/g.36358  ORF Transcript_11758/g.36358 Transcript_11758/m.36358 type:complete len:240 (-) Transcript_11758:90-809(-)
MSPPKLILVFVILHCLLLVLTACLGRVGPPSTRSHEGVALVPLTEAVQHDCDDEADNAKGERRSSEHDEEHKQPGCDGAIWRRRWRWWRRRVEQRKEQLRLRAELIVERDESRTVIVQGVTGGREDGLRDELSLCYVQIALPRLACLATHLEEPDHGHRRVARWLECTTIHQRSSPAHAPQADVARTFPKTVGEDNELALGHAKRLGGRGGHTLGAVRLGDPHRKAVDHPRLCVVRIRA